MVSEICWVRGRREKVLAPIDDTAAEQVPGKTLSLERERQRRNGNSFNDSRFREKGAGNVARLLHRYPSSNPSLNPFWRILTPSSSPPLFARAKPYLVTPDFPLYRKHSEKESYFKMLGRGRKSRAESGQDPLLASFPTPLTP